MADNETFGQRLRRLRKKQGLTLADVAELIKVSLKTIQRWEQDTRQPRADDIKKLAAALHVTEDELLNGVPDQGGWVLHVEIGNTKEDFIDMKTLASKPVCAIITDKDAGFIKVGGDYSLWTDDALFKKILADLKKLRDAVIANGKVLGGIKEQ